MRAWRHSSLFIRRRLRDTAGALAPFFFFFNA
jgi:hypothetical protein